MLKSLTILGLLTLCISACTQKPFPVNGKDQPSHTQGQAEDTQNSVGLAREEVDEENAANAERYAYYKTHPKEYFKAAVAPANAANWILVAIGIGGSFLAGITLLIIKRQVDLQGAAMQQWVEVETRGVSVKTKWDSPFSLELQFEAVNNTPFVLTINKIVTTVALWADRFEEFTVEAGDRLAPAKDGKISGHPFYVETSMETKERFEAGILFTINFEIAFTDCMGKRRTQWFGGLWDCRPDELKRMSYMGYVPEKKEKQYDPHSRRGWFSRAIQRLKLPPKPN